MHRERSMRRSPSVSTYGSMEPNEVIGSNGTGPDSGSRAAVPEGILATPAIINTPLTNQPHAEAVSPSLLSLDPVEMDVTPRIGSASRTETDRGPDRPGPLFPFWNFGRPREISAENS